MNPDPPNRTANTTSMEIPLSDLLTLVTEHWRLSDGVAGPAGNTGVARHSARRIGDLLGKWGFEVRPLDGKPFDAGLAAKVVDTVDDPSAAAGTDTVDETVSPMILWRDNVVKTAEVVVRRGTGAVGGR